MKQLFTIGALLLFSLGAMAQTVGKKAPKLSLTAYNREKEDGLLQFEVDVRMADCISFVELRPEGSKKPIQVFVSEKDYYLSEENGRDILLRIPLCSLKDVLRKKESVSTALTIFSKSGKPIYTNELSVTKTELLGAVGELH